MSEGYGVDPKFSQILIELAECYPNVRMREGTYRAYARALEGLTLEEVRQAALRAGRESQFFPSPAELRKYVQPPADDAALIQWSALAQAASSVGVWRSVAIADPAAAHAMKQVFGSWVAYCEAEGPAVGARRQEYFAAYREARRRQAAPHTPTTIFQGRTDRGLGFISRHGEVTSDIKASELPAAPDMKQLPPVDE